MMHEIPNDNKVTPIAPALVAMGMRAISQRLYTYIALLLTAGGFAFVLYDPTVMRLIGISLWGVFVIATAAIIGGTK